MKLNNFKAERSYISPTSLIYNGDLGLLFDMGRVLFNIKVKTQELKIGPKILEDRILQRVLSKKNK